MRNIWADAADAEVSRIAAAIGAREAVVYHTDFPSLEHDSPFRRLKDANHVEEAEAESPECYPCDDYGLIPSGDWLTAPKPCPDCDKGRQKQVEMERDAQDLANGAAMRLLMESGYSWTLHPYRQPCNGQMVVKLNNQGYTYVGDTLPEAVTAALGEPPTQHSREPVRVYAADMEWHDAEHL